MSPPSGSPASAAQWHAMTPQTRPLSISILELAPTSVTLALTRSPPTPAPGHQHLTPAQHVVHSLAHSHHSHSHAHHSQSHSNASGSSCNTGGGSKKKKKNRRNLNPGPALDSDENDDEDDSGSASNAVPGAYPSLLLEGQTFKDMLSHGVVVTMDGMPWSRIVAHVSDDADEEDPVAVDDEEADWEDEDEGHAHDEETVGTTSGTAPHAARRRKGRRPSRESGPATRKLRAHDKATGAPRWDKERAVVVVYDLDPSKEHEIELQIVGLAGEVKESFGESFLMTHAANAGSTRVQRRAHTARIAEQLEFASKIESELFALAVQATIQIQLGQHTGTTGRRLVSTCCGTGIA